MEANHPGEFMRGIMKGYYRVVAGKSLDDEKGIQFDNELVRRHLNLGSRDVHIMPVPEGSGGGGFFKVVLGVALIAAAFAFAPAVVGALGPTQGLGAVAFSIGSFNVTYSSIALFGLKLALSGMAQILTPTPKIGDTTSDYSTRERADERPSFIFNGAVNTTEQGGPVPVVYGRMVVGSTVISGGIVSEQI